MVSCIEMFSVYSQLSDIPNEFRNACILVDVHRIFQDCLFVHENAKGLAFIAPIVFFVSGFMGRKAVVYFTVMKY